jgi:CheY-like chemotaxis protein
MSILRDCKIGEGKRALVVDDEPLVGQIMCRVLEQMGYTADHALDGNQAINLAKEQNYEVIICDILMPHINGMALYDLWCEQAPELAARTVFVTGDNLGFETGDFIKRTGRPCIFKPFRLITLAEIIMQMQTASDGTPVSVG